MLSTLNGWTSDIDGIDDDIEFKARLASYLDCSDCAATMEEFLESLKTNEISVSDITQSLPTIASIPTTPDDSLSSQRTYESIQTSSNREMVEEKGESIGKIEEGKCNKI